MHHKRLIIAAAVVPLLYLAVMRFSSGIFLVLLTFFSTLALAEFYAMYRLQSSLRYAGLFWGAAIPVVFLYAPQYFSDVLLFSVLSIMTLRLFILRDTTGSGSAVSAAVFGILYLPCLLTFQLTLHRNGPEWIVLLYAAVWASDSMAYYVGKGIGKIKLYPEVSPNKTMEGALGSVAGGVLGAVLIKTALVDRLSIPHAALLGLAVGVTTIIGDLAESMFKRDAGVKDSGSIIPGHGGVLDKLDGVTFAGPAFYWVCKGLGLLG